MLGQTMLKLSHLRLESEIEGISTDGYTATTNASLNLNWELDGQQSQVYRALKLDMSCHQAVSGIRNHVTCNVTPILTHHTILENCNSSSHLNTLMVLLRLKGVSELCQHIQYLCQNTQYTLKWFSACKAEYGVRFCRLCWEIREVTWVII